MSIQKRGGNRVEKVGALGDGGEGDGVGAACCGEGFEAWDGAVVVHAAGALVRGEGTGGGEEEVGEDLVEEFGGEGGEGHGSFI